MRKKLWWTNWMDIFLIDDDDLLGKYHTIWEKVSADIKKDFYSKTCVSKNKRHYFSNRESTENVVL